MYLLILNQAFYGLMGAFYIVYFQKMKCSLKCKIQNKSLNLLLMKWFKMVRPFLN